MNEFRKIKEYLAGSRPTAVNLVAALNRMERVLVAHQPCLSRNGKSYYIRKRSRSGRKHARRLPADRRELSGATPSRDGNPYAL